MWPNLQPSSSEEGSEGLGPAIGAARSAVRTPGLTTAVSRISRL